MNRSLVLSLAVVSAILVATAACGPDYPLCKVGEYRACNCEDGEGGYQRCNASEDEFDACVCGATTPGFDAGAAAPGTAKYLEACTTDADCQSSFCALFSNRGGNRCTLHCTSDADCPAPSPGCNPKQECRVP